MHQFLKFILFWNNTLHVLDGLSVHHQEFKTVHTATGTCQTDTVTCLLASRSQYLLDIYLLLCVQSWTPDDGWKDRPKHAECYSKIKWIWETGACSWFYYREFDSCMFLFICNSILKSGLYDLKILCDSGVCQLNLCCIVHFLTILCVRMIFIGWWSNVICITGVTKWKICADYWLWHRIWIWIGTSARKNGRNVLQYLQIAFAWALLGRGTYK